MISEKLISKQAWKISEVVRKVLARFHPFSGRRDEPQPYLRPIISESYAALPSKPHLVPYLLQST